MTQQANRSSNVALVIISLATIVAVYLGWRLFWFLTDDAFIAFRYISNSHLGYGYVWNAPPFRPVEGYTSFLWVLLLDVVWRVSGVEPPAAANYFSLIFTYLTLVVGGLMVLRMKLRAELERHRLLFLCLVLLGVITNRTFLAWSSSGLETAMFNFFLTCWIYCCLFAKRNRGRWTFWLTLTTSLLCLTRPDGLLFAAVTLALIFKAIKESGNRSQEPGAVGHWSLTAALKSALWAAPLLIIPGHVWWRRAVYGAWLPNTYYAKTIAGRIWPQSGLRYCLSFVIEYSLWVWLLLLLVVIASRLRRVRTFKDLAQVSRAKALVCLALLGQFLYYTIVIGGDHFEYRVYSQLVLLIFITFLWQLNALRLNAKGAALLFALFIALSWPIPWLHWYATHNLIDRRTTVLMRVSMVKAAQRAFSPTPSFVLSYLREFDNLQFWLIGHSVCMRHQEHKAFYLHQTKSLPSRAEGMRLPAENYPVLIASSVGVVSWVLPRVNIIDALGLNDYVVARNPDLNLPIEMAHERRPPRGYVECFAANVVLEQGQFKVGRRSEEMTADKIRKCEQDFADSIKVAKPPDRSPVIQNSIDDPRFFVRQQYLDVLAREPDADGLTYWSDHLAICPTGSYCFNDSRISIPFILSDASESRETAQFTYRLYAVSFGAVPRFADFIRDRNLLGEYQVDWRDQVELVPTHRSFIAGWVLRDSFRARYPDSMSAEEFVKRLFANAQLDSFTAERENLTNGLRGGKSRADVLYEIIEDQEFKRRVDEQSLVPMLLLMHLRRDVDHDHVYQTWLDKLKRGEPVDARHVICLVLTSEEYQRRFGLVVTHSNAECP